MKYRLFKYFFFLLLFFNDEISYSQTWRELNDSIIYYFNKNQFRKGIPVGEKAVLAAKTEFGESDSNYVKSLFSLGELYFNMGEYEKAELNYKKGLTIQEKLTGENSVEYAKNLNQLAVLYEDMNQYQKAEPLYIKVLKTRRKLLGELHSDYVNSVNNLGFLYKEMGWYEKAKPLYFEALKIREKTVGQNHYDYIQSAFNYGIALVHLGQYEAAENLYNRTLKAQKKIKENSDIDFCFGMECLANLYEATGRHSEAEKSYNEIISIRKRGKENKNYTTSLSYLANLYRRTGRLEKAEPLYVEVVNILKRIAREDDLHYSSSLNNLGGLYIEMGQYEKAEVYISMAVVNTEKVLGRNHPQYAICLSSLANLYQIKEDYETAEALYRGASDVFKHLSGDFSLDYSTSLNNLAVLFDEMKQYDKAEPLYLQAMEIDKKILGDNNAEYAMVIQNLALLYTNIGKYDKAESLYLQAINVYKKIFGENNTRYSQALMNLAKLYRLTGNYAKAETLTIQGNLIEIESLKKIFLVCSEKEKSNFVSNKVFVLNDQNSIIYHYPKVSNKLIINTYDLQLFLRSLILTDTKNVLGSVKKNGDKKLQQLYAEWQKQREVISKEYLLPIASRRKDLIQKEYEAEISEKELIRLSSALKEQNAALEISVADISNQLNNDEAAIEFVRFKINNGQNADSVMYAAYILLKGDSAPAFVPLFEEKQLQELLDSAGRSATSIAKIFYRGLEIKGRNTLLGKELFKLVWEPLEPYLRNIKSVSYSPAGKLYGIAFHAMAVDSNALLMDKYQLQQYTSTRQIVLRNQDNKNIKPKDIVLFGDASFSMDSLQLVNQRSTNQNRDIIGSNFTLLTRAESSSIWPELPGTAEEVKRIQSLFKENRLSTQMFTQIDASEINLKTLKENSPQVLHIATHGFFLPEPDKEKNKREFNQENIFRLVDYPLLRSGLILSGANYAWSGKAPIDGVEDGIATAYEISQLNLSNTELVVLSACETALGDVKGSEGVFGLQRAFKMAGVKKMIVSLWQVPDKETAELMTTFYSYWMKGKTINDAFTQAQADMRKKYSPFYWAAFVLVE